MSNSNFLDVSPLKKTVRLTSESDSARAKSDRRGCQAELRGGSRG